MPLPSSITDLSQNPALNGPDGNTDLPSSLDDGLRLAYAFTAQLRDGVGFDANAIKTALGYTPVQQGTGPSQTPAEVKIGWDGASRLRVQVDATDYGTSWPINISGNASTATTAANATNAAAVGGVAETAIARSLTPGELVGFAWDSGTQTVIARVNAFTRYVYTEWSRVENRPTNLSQFANGPGYVTASNVVAKLDTVTGMGRVSGQNALYAQVTGLGTAAWGVTVSDERLKLDIADTTADSLEKIDRIRFVGFRFIEGIDNGARHDVGALAQQLEEIEPRWVLQGGTWMQLDVGEMLLDAMHAIQQLHGLVRVQAARIAALEGRA